MSLQSLKVTYGSTKRRFSIPRTIPFTDFRERVVTLFAITEDVTVSYKDPDGDMIEVSSEDEFREMFRITSSETLAINLQTPSTPPPAPRSAQGFAERAAADAEAHATRAADDARAYSQRAADNAQASVESILSGLGTFLSAFQTGFGGPGFGAGPGRRPRGRRPGPREGFGAFAPFMAALAPLAAAFHQGGSGMCDVSERTSAAFRQLKDAVASAENRDEILRTARDVFPSVREWAMANLSGDLSPAVIDELCNTVSQRVQPVGGQRIAGLMSDLIRAALADEAVLRILRHIPWEATQSLDAELRGPGGRRGGMGGGRFDIHRAVECDSCGKAPIVGSRYKATNRPSYDICGVCYNNESVNKDGMEFKECKYLWECSYPDAVVPPSPIGFGDRGPAVAFLQKILTDLGYMNASMYRWRVGFYGPNTRAAVEQFQREYGLESVAEIGQYDATTAASLTSVIEAQVPPTATAGGAPSGDAAAGAGQSQSRADAPGPEPSPAQG